MTDRKTYRVSFSKKKSRQLPRGRLFASKLLAVVAASALVPSPLRILLHRLRGVRFDDPKRVFIGENVTLDRVFPEKIRIGKDVMLTSDCIIIAHFYDARHQGHVFNTGEIRIGNGVFFGARSMVVAQITVGDNAVIAAGAIVTRDVPAGAIVAGVPAKQIGNRGTQDVDDSIPTLSDLMR